MDTSIKFTLLKSDDGGWIINPDNAFPLTIYAPSERVVKELKNLLDKWMNDGLNKAVKKIIPFMQTHNIQCKEVNDYIKEFKPLYLYKIEELKKNPPEELIDPDMDEDEQLDEIKFAAADLLDIQPDCDLVTLFEAAPDSKAFIKELSTLLCLTYVHAFYAQERKKERLDPDVIDMFGGWRISPVGDGRTCPCCRRMEEKKYPKDQYPKTPLHIGCRCTVQSI